MPGELVLADLVGGQGGGPARGGGAGRVGPPATRCRLCVLRQIGDKLVRRDDSINFVSLPRSLDPYTAANPPPGWRLPPVVLALMAQRGILLPRTAFTYLNLGPIRQTGLELWLEQQVSRSLAASVNYSGPAGDGNGVPSPPDSKPRCCSRRGDVAGNACSDLTSTRLIQSCSTSPGCMFDGTGWVLPSGSWRFISSSDAVMVGSTYHAGTSGA